MIDLPTIVLPRDNISLRVPTTHTKVRQLETLNIQPVVTASTPVYVVRRNVSATLATVNTQIVRNRISTISQLTASVQTPNGSIQAVAAGNSDAPISVAVTRSRIPAALSIGASATTGAETSPVFGGSFSRAINIQ
jgi:hypothetical protein